MSHGDHGSDPGARGELTLVVTVGALAVALLGPAAGAALAVPLHPVEALGWATGADPGLLAAALLRVVGLVLAAHALVVALLTLLADLLRARPLARLAALLAVGPVRAVVLRAGGAVLGTGLLLAPGTVAAASPSVGPVPAPPTRVLSVPGPGDEPGPVETARPLPPAGADQGADARQGPTGDSDATDEARPGPTGQDVAQVRPVADAASDGHAEARAPDAGGTESDGDGSAAGPPAGTAGRQVGRWRTVTVQSGDHLWGLAVRDVAAHLGTAPTDAEVHRHWTAVIEANRGHLVVPDDPDLVLPGQHLVLPPVDGA